MSYRSVRDVLDNYMEAFLEAQQWCKGLPQRSECPEFSAAVAIVEQELKARVLRFQDARDRADEKTLTTYLQYDPQEDLQEAIGELSEKQPRDHDELFAVLAEFYRRVSEALVESTRVLESTPAVGLFEDLQSEVQTAIANQAWQLRNET